MKKSQCQSCLKDKSNLTCQNCSQDCCKECIIFVDCNEFEIVTLLPVKIQEKAFCPSCFNIEASPIIAEYKEILDKAKSVNVYEIEQSQETHKMPRHERPIIIKECNDRNETLMRLAFFAVQRGFNTIIDVDLKSRKSHEGGTYRKLVWSGKAIPINRLKP